MLNRHRLTQVLLVCLVALVFSPLWAHEGGGFRGGSGGAGGGKGGAGGAQGASGGKGGTQGAGSHGGAPQGGGGTPHPHNAPPSTPHTGGTGIPGGGTGTPHVTNNTGTPRVINNTGTPKITTGTVTGTPHTTVGGAAGAHAVGTTVVNNKNVNVTNLQSNVNRTPQIHGTVGIHEAEHFHHEIGANHFGPVEHGVPAYHNVAMLHQPGPHWNAYHQAYVGNHPVHLAYAGYRPSYYYHPWYHGPWAGHAWGWGWGYSPGLSFGFAGSGFGIGVGSGWGYPVYYGPYGRYGYWGRPLGWGFGGWGLGTAVYSSGYYPYYNPYYSVAAYPNVVYNYSTPIPVAVQAPAGALAANVNNPYASNQPQGNPAFDAARDAFRQGDYLTALSNVDAAIKQSQTDSVMHEFRSLTLFALHDYRQSAAVIHSVLAVGPGWDWTTMSSLYPDPAIYTEQLQTLENYAASNPRAADAHFLLAYHDMIGNQKGAAARELRTVTALMPNDRLARELLTMVQGPPQQAQLDPNAVPAPGSDPFAPVSNPPATATNDVPPAPDVPAVDKDQLPGTWNASRGDGSKFRLTMLPDGNFTWKYSAPNQKGDEFSGTYTVDGPVLVLERKDGGALAGTATFQNNDRMNFKMVGGPPEDNGLDFAR